MEWTRILAYITGNVDQELLLRNEYLAAENRILRAKLNRRLRFSDAERATLGEIGFRPDCRALNEVATAAQPDTILAWYRQCVARKFDGSQARRGPGGPRIDQDVEGLIVRIARENRSWGYDRIVGASPIWDIMSPIRQSAMCCVATYTARTRAQTYDHLGGIHSDPPPNPPFVAGTLRRLSRSILDRTRATVQSR